jgi:hypothetical protein
MFLGVFVLADIVKVGRLVVMMRGGVMVSGRLVVMLTCRMLRTVPLWYSFLENETSPASHSLSTTPAG